MKPYNDIELLQLKIKHGKNFNETLAQDGRCPVELLEQLSGAREPYVKNGICYNKSTPHYLLYDKLILDDDSGVSNCAKERLIDRAKHNDKHYKMVGHRVENIYCDNFKCDNPIIFAKKFCMVLHTKTDIIKHAKKVGIKFSRKKGGLTQGVLVNMMQREKDKRLEIGNKRSKIKFDYYVYPNKYLILKYEKRHRCNLLRTKVKNASRDTIKSIEHSNIRDYYIKGHLFCVLQNVYFDSEKYSKSYHRKYGPTKTVSDRRIKILKINKDYTEKLIKTYELESFKGNFVLKVICDFFGIKLKNKKSALSEVKKLIS